ncbi:macrophage mannose receptor 1-like [Mya arenaria]|uniref:macrophage mannose receptor 1-like n=1 Tax=Mya arenaria TaxID=6604 RepID=UPI0022E2CD51|nr:macrophage mannose receptor 1-like [Mya arenaria]
MTGQSQPLGTLAEFDCKPQGPDTGMMNWLAIDFQQQRGFVANSSDTQLQTCPGNPPTTDLITTSSPTEIMMNSSTEMPTEIMTSSTEKTTEMMTSSTKMPTEMMTSSTEKTTEMMTSSTEKPTEMMTSSTEMTTQMPTTMETTTIKMTSTTETMTAPTTTTPQTTESSTVPTTTMAKSTQTSTMSTTAMPSFTTTSASMTTTQSQMSTTPLPGTEYGCSQRYYQYAAHDDGVLFTVDKTCFELVPTRHSWALAENDCRNRGGHLATIDSAMKQSAIYQVVKTYQGSNVWIGLHDINVEENFEWTSGEVLNYTNWYPGRKNAFLHFSQDCVSVWLGTHLGRWEDESCSQTHAYLCEFPGVLSSQTYTTSATGSDGNTHLCSPQVRNLAQRYGTALVQHDKSCYELLHNQVTWGHAEQLCKQAGGHLANIGDASEQAYIQDFMMRHNPNRAVWIGLNDHRTEGQFHWTNGAAVTYTNWIAGHQDNFLNHNIEDCVALVPYKNGTWDDIPCGSQGFFGDSGETHLGFCEYR